MAIIATTKLSSKGQVVIPENLRKKLNLQPGSQFVVVGDKGVVILQSISPPSLDEFDELAEKVRKSAEKADSKKSARKNAIAKVRGKK